MQLDPTLAAPQEQATSGEQKVLQMVNLGRTPSVPLRDEEMELGGGRVRAVSTGPAKGEPIKRSIGAG
jgi:hypothetical protein